MNLSEKRLYDVVIPVFNGIDFFKQCYATVKLYTSSGHTIVIVDDGTTDTEMKAYLAAIAQDLDTSVVTLPENRGFVHAVNRGMAISRNHIVLLNSDTEVTPGWLEKMDAALFSAPYIGTVTPWTNNGTICSLPKFCEDNELPEGVSANDISEIAQQVCLGEYPVLPTAVGFCMAIRREVIDAVGNFDEQAYGKGYGEEGDFCMRARLAGYRNILDDRTFIYHKGKMTFGASHDAVIDVHTEILMERFPQYRSDVNDFFAKDPLLQTRSRINRIIEHRQGKRHILHLLHRDPLEGWYGVRSGVEYHVLTLAESLEAIGDVVSFVLASDGQELFFLEKNRQGAWHRMRLPLPNDISHETQYDGFFREKLHEILDIYHIDLIHVHHLFNIPKDLSTLIEPWQGGLCLTLHDFYLLCPTINLINTEGEYCHGGNASYCPACVRAQIGSPIDIPAWRKMHQANIAYAQKVYAPSESAAQITHELLLDGLEPLITIREHAVQSYPRLESASRLPGTRLKVGFLGQVFSNKGSRLASELALTAPADAFEWFFIGKVIDPRCAAIRQENIHFLGEYEQKDLPEIFARTGIDVVLFCSVWPETFSYTLSEAWGNGRPALVGPLGAPADRVRKHGGGWIVDRLTPEAFLGQLMQIREHPDEYRRVCEQVRAMDVSPPEKNTLAYLEDYNAMIREHPLPEIRENSSRPFWPGAILDGGEMIQAMTLESQRLQLDNQRLEGEIDKLRQYITELSEFIAAKEEIITEAFTQIEAFKTANQQLHGLMNELQLERERIFNTLSWRITSPLRKIAMLLKGNRP